VKQVLCIFFIVHLSLSLCFSLPIDCNDSINPLPEKQIAVLIENLNAAFYLRDSLKQQVRQAYCYGIYYNNEELKAVAYNYLGFEQYVKANIDSAYYYLNDAYKILSSKPPSLTFIRNLKMLGLVNLLEEDIISAKKHFDETENLSKKLNINTELADAYNNKGLMYMQFNQHQKAQINLQNAIDQFKIFNDQTNLGYAYLNLAKSKHLQQVSKDSIFYFAEQAGQTWEASKYQRGLAYYNTFIGDLYKDTDEEKSFEYYKKAISIVEKNNFGIELSMLYYNCADYYFNQNLNKQSFTYALKSVEAAIEKKDINALRKSHNLITKNFTFNTKDEANAYHSKISSFLLNTPDYSRKALTEILNTESKNKALVEKNNRSTLINTVLLGSLLALSILLLVIWKLLQQRTKRQQSLDELNQKVTTQNNSLVNTQKLLAHSIEKLQSFAHVVSHDLKAPLRTINGFAKVAIKQNKPVNSSLEDSLLQIASLSSNLTEMVDDILANAMNKNEISLSKVDLNIVVNKVLNNLKYDIEKHDVIIIRSELPKVVGCENQLVQLFQNLLSNAIAYKHSNRKLVLKLYYTKNKEGLAISIKDNGKGIRDELLPNIFTKNNRGDEMDKSGTGLGLYTCKKTMQELQGTIKVKSKIGIGSEFILLFPAGVDKIKSWT